MKKQIISLIAGVGLVLFSSVSMLRLPAQAQSSQPRDCESTAIVYCGAYTTAELSQKMTGDVPAIFAHYGISKDHFSSFVDGLVYKDGRVTVGDKVVATGAISTGRDYKPGSTKVAGLNIYERPTQIAYAANTTSIQAFVMLNADGSFKYAILKSCANPIRATAVPVPKPGVDIQKDVSKAVVAVGEEFTYTVKVTNTGETDLSNLTVTDQAPANIAFVPGSASDATVTETAFEAVIASLAKGQSKTFTFKAKFTKYVSTNVVNQACVSVEGLKDCDTAENKPEEPKEEPKDNCPVPGKEHLPKDSPECKEEPKEEPEDNCPIPGKEHLPKDSPECKETPPITPVSTPPTVVTPVTVVEQLPATGPAEVISGVTGLSSLTYGLVSFVRSKKDLLGAALKK